MMMYNIWYSLEIFCFQFGIQNCLSHVGRKSPSLVLAAFAIPIQDTKLDKLNECNRMEWLNYDSSSILYEQELGAWGDSQGCCAAQLKMSRRAPHVNTR